MRQYADPNSFEAIVCRVSCVGFIIGLCAGLFLGTWAHITLFWGRDTTNDISVILCWALMTACLFAILYITRKEGRLHE